MRSVWYHKVQKICLHRFTKIVFITCVLSFLIIDIILIIYLSSLGNEPLNQKPTLSSQRSDHIGDSTSHWLDNGCKTVQPNPDIALRHNHYVFYNFIKAERKYNCSKSVTFATHGDYRYLYNLKEICLRWEGGISVSVYSPGDDVLSSLKTIIYLRLCEKSCVKQKVTFHIFVDVEHVSPDYRELLHSYDNLLQKELREICNTEPWKATRRSYAHMFRIKYPINVARNIAIEGSYTYLVLTADIELYPSVNLMREFLLMIKEKGAFGRRTVYVLPEFQVLPNITLPYNKLDLKEKFKQGKAETFHANVCPMCHEIPGFSEWLLSPVSPGMESVLIVSKRDGRYAVWEPVFIHIKNSIRFNELLYWDGTKDKMVLAYQMCLEGYDFAILNNGFLVHKSEDFLKTKDNYLTEYRKQMIRTQSVLVEETIIPALHNIFGKNHKCGIEEL